MATLIKSPDEIKDYLVVDGTFRVDTLLPYIEAASTEVKRLLGKELYDILATYYNETDPGTTPALDALLPYVQRPLVFFAFLKGFDVFNVNIGNNGFGVVQNQTLAPASKDRTESLRKNMSDNAYDAMEALLLFLEDNIDDYDDWTASDAYAYQYELLITSAYRFDELYKINRSRLTYLEWRPTMVDVEYLQIIPVVSKEVLDELKTEAQDGDMTAPNLVIYPMLQKALAYLTAAEKGEEKMRGIGLHYLNSTKQLMDANIGDYPTYAASSVYISTQTSYQRYENDENLNIAVF